MPNSSAPRIARSTATQAITFEKVKCRWPPRTSQMLSSGCSQISARCVTSARWMPQLAFGRARPRCIS